MEDLTPMLAALAAEGGELESGSLGVPVDPVEAVGWDGDALEAQAFAFLAVRSLRGLPRYTTQITHWNVIAPFLPGVG